MADIGTGKKGNATLMASQPWVIENFQTKDAASTADAQNVKTTGAQSIAGAKTFTDGATFNGSATFTGNVTVPAVTDASADTAPATVKYVKDKVSTLFEYKGSKATYAELPATGNKTGDVWNVTADGANYAWDGTAWDKLSEDLSGFALGSEVVKLTGDQTIGGAKTFTGAASFGSTLAVTGAATLSGGAVVPTGAKVTLTDAPVADTDAANKKYIDDAIAGLASDENTAHLAGAETFTGAKTFSAGAVIPTGAALTVTDAPTANTDAANKGYVDGKITGLASDTRLVHTTGAETVAGVKTFSDEVSLAGGAAVPTGKAITIADAPTAGTDAVNKTYADGLVTGLASDSRLVHTTGDETIAGAKSFSGTVALNNGATVPTGKALTVTDAPTANTDAANKGYVDGKIDDLASDSRLVHITGAETVTGAKTFSASVALNGGAAVPTGKTLTVTDAPTANTDAANKKYVDDTVAGSTVVHTSGDESIAGTKTFTGAVVVPAPTGDTNPATKAYVDNAISDLTGGGVVHLAGAEEITGVKTFAATPVIKAGAKITLTDAPVAATDGANKGYVDAITSGTRAFSKIRLTDDNGDDWFIGIDSESETLTIEPVSAP